MGAVHICNLYSVTKGQQAIRDAFRVMTDHAGNLPSLPGIFPDQMAPVVRHGADGRELAMLRWGFPSPPGVPGNRVVTNIRNTGSRGEKQDPPVSSPEMAPALLL